MKVAKRFGENRSQCDHSLLLPNPSLRPQTEQAGALTRCLSGVRACRRNANTFPSSAESPWISAAGSALPNRCSISSSMPSK